MRLIVVLLLAGFSFCASAQTVYKTPCRAKYYLATCGMVKNVSEALDLSTAISLGLGSCGICHPQTRQSQGLKANPQGEKKKTTQCLGYTKSGRQCQHMTSIANGYCYQHQPK
jgi:hypothetical protein